MVDTCRSTVTALEAREAASAEARESASTGPRARLHRHRAAVHFATLLTEVLTHRRPAAHLTRHTRPAVLALITRLTGHPHLTLHQVHSAEPADGVLEVCARIATPARSRAVAFRMERTPADAWLCTRLDIR
jgi:hypothetical protein